MQILTEKYYKEYRKKIGNDLKKRYDAMKKDLKSCDFEYLIEASGEGRMETDKGFVRIRKINHRRDFLCAVKVSL